MEGSKPREKHNTGTDTTQNHRKHGIESASEIGSFSSARATKTAATNSVAIMGTPTRPIALTAFLFTIFTTPCDCIGSWGKKPTEIKNEGTDDSKINNSNSSNIDHNVNKTYLDLFGESAKEFLTQKAPEMIKNVIPATDDTCRWDWRYARCEPYCECSFQPKLPGDFHLGRACRKRGVEDQSGNNETGNAHIEGFNDVIYKKYCILDNNNEGDSAAQQGLSPPPPSIPSPFPFIAKSGKASWKVLRTKTDPVVARVVEEFEVMHGRVQTVVCQDLKTRCDDSETAQSKGKQEDSDNNNENISLEVAWQEQLFCRNTVRECKAN